MIHNGLKRFQDKNILLLQGPVGPFFYRLSQKFLPVAKSVHKINFNGGDFIFYSKNCYNYTDSLDNLKYFLHNFLLEHQIDYVLMFNDCRPVHTIAKIAAAELNIHIGVFEEGYIRPDFITFENGGVNAYSSIPKEKPFYDSHIAIQTTPTINVGNAFPAMATYAGIYWFFSFIFSLYFNNSLHHRSLSPFEILPWGRSFYRKYKYKFQEEKFYDKLKKLKKQYFLVPLQVYNDTQILTHYEKGNIENFIDDVMKSFASHSNGKDHLVFKHHPMDRGYKNYKNYILSLSIKYDIKDRVIYIHDGHLPTLLDNAKGTVMINSTVGISAMYHQCPLKVCGNAFYDIEGLTYQGRLDSFWDEAQNYKPDQKLFENFKNYIIAKIQINGSFYKDIFEI